MGSEQSLLNKVRADTNVPPTGSFSVATAEELESHLAVSWYADFELTDAVRPSYNLRVVPAQGYRHDVYHDEQSRTSVPVLMGSVSRRNLFEVFMTMLDPLGSEVDVVLETSHNRWSGGHADLYREHIDLPVLKSILWDFEDLLLNDGFVGIAVLNPDIPQEVQLDEHKLLIVYGEGLQVYEGIFSEQRVYCRDDIKFITEAEHVHLSDDGHYDQFEELKGRLGCD